MRKFFVFCLQIHLEYNECYFFMRSVDLWQIQKPHPQQIMATKELSRVRSDKYVDILEVNCAEIRMSETLFMCCCFNITFSWKTISFPLKWIPACNFVQVKIFKKYCEFWKSQFFTKTKFNILSVKDTHRILCQFVHKP